MKAVRIHEHGSIDVLMWEEIKSQECPDDKVRVRIKAAALNHLDIWIRKGFDGISLPMPLIMGSDGAGIITEIGRDVTNLKTGDEVVIQPNTFCGRCSACQSGKENFCQTYGILGETENGTQANEIILYPKNIHPKPKHLSFEAAASMQLVFITAYQMLVRRAKLTAGEYVLIYGATSGVGSAAIQIAKYLNSKVITTVGSNDKFPHAEKMGADFSVNHNDSNWVKKVKNITDGKGINVVFEHVGASTWSSSLRLLARGGRIVTCGATTGHKVNIDLRHLFMKQQSILGSTMSDINTFNTVMKLIDQKVFFPFIDKIFPFENIRDAHTRIEDRCQYGKIVLSDNG